MDLVHDEKDTIKEETVNGSSQDPEEMVQEAGGEDTAAADEAPAEPEEPAKEEVPSEPEEAAEEEAPAEPEEPAKEEESSEPEEPAEAETPAEPEEPAKEEVSSEPEEPAEEEATAEPEEPAKQEEPAEPEEPAEAEKPQEAEEPAEDEEPEEDEVPEEYEQEPDTVSENTAPIRTKHHRGRREKGRHTFLKAAGAILGVIVVLAAAVYAGMTVFFQSHFLFYTTINGVDFSMKSVSDVEDYMSQQVADYTLTLKESDGSTEVIKGSDISTEYVPGDQLEALLEEQDALQWPLSLSEHPEIEASVGVTYDESALEEVADGLRCTQEDRQIASENAYPVFKDTEFVIQPEVIGTELDKDVFIQAVSTAINGFQDELNLKEAGCYILPEYVSTSEEVEEAAEKMNGYLKAQITYDFDPDTVVVGAAEIAPWVKVNRDTMEVSLKQGSVKQYIGELADQYDTYGDKRKFKTASGKTVTVKGGSYGWQIDQDEETEALLQDIKDGNVVEREPAYTHRAASHGTNDVGSTYAEVDLTNQHMYYTKDGEVVLESDVVTGNPNKGNGTPQGTYTITYKERNATLRGDRQPDGSYGYETPVAYWMPFNGGIGFHDATWQSSFGGDRYLTHGSHGCVNMPKSKAEELYGLISAGDPVVCYYSE